MKLYFDIGNTNIKLNFVNNKINKYISYQTNVLYTFDSFWLGLPKEIKNAKVTKIIICSVVPKITPIIKDLSKKYFQINPLILGYPLKNGIQLQIDDTKSIGADLVALGVFANSKGNNVIIVNLGTATTIIHVKNSILKGVIIMPGIETQTNAIISNAAKISDISIKFSKNNIGKNTIDALSIGIINSHIFAIKEHIKTIDLNAKVIISGGNAKKIIHHINCEYIKEATIEGMKIIETINEK